MRLPLDAVCTYVRPTLCRRPGTVPATDFSKRLLGNDCAAKTIFLQRRLRCPFAPSNRTSARILQRLSDTSTPAELIRTVLASNKRPEPSDEIFSPSLRRALSYAVVCAVRIINLNLNSKTLREFPCLFLQKKKKKSSFYPAFLAELKCVS